MEIRHISIIIKLLSLFRFQILDTLYPAHLHMQFLNVHQGLPHILSLGARHPVSKMTIPLGPFWRVKLTIIQHLQLMYTHIPHNVELKPIAKTTFQGFVPRSI